MEETTATVVYNKTPVFKLPIYPTNSMGGIKNLTIRELERSGKNVDNPEFTLFINDREQILMQDHERLEKYWEHFTDPYLVVKNMENVNDFLNRLVIDHFSFFNGTTYDDYMNEKTKEITKYGSRYGPEYVRDEMATLKRYENFRENDNLYIMENDIYGVESPEDVERLEVSPLRERLEIDIKRFTQERGMSYTIAYEWCDYSVNMVLYVYKEVPDILRDYEGGDVINKTFFSEC